MLAAGNDDLKTLGRTFRRPVRHRGLGRGDHDPVRLRAHPHVPPEIERYISAAQPASGQAREPGLPAEQRMSRDSKRAAHAGPEAPEETRQRGTGGSPVSSRGRLPVRRRGAPYKNLGIRSNNPGMAVEGSGRASDLEMKLEYLRDTHGRRVVTFATATPIANSMGEAYIMHRYLRPDLLARPASRASTMGQHVRRDHNRHRGRPRGGMRIKTGSPSSATSRAAVHVAGLRRHQDHGRPQAPDTGADRRQAGGRPGRAVGAAARIHAEPRHMPEAVRSRAVLPDEDNMLKISNNGRLAALDPRLAGLRAPECGKLDIAAQNIARIEHEYRGHPLLRQRREPPARHGQPPDRLLRPRHPRRQEPLERLRVPARQGRRIRR